MGFLDWWRRRARVDPTDVSTAEDDVQVVRRADEEAPAALRDACAAHPELAAAYLFRAQRGPADYLVLGVVLDAAVSEERLGEIERDLEARAQPLRVGVETVGPETLRDVQRQVEPLFEREPVGP
jgi:hypothetical protein